MDKWQQLWDTAVLSARDDEHPATIRVNEQDPNLVTLLYGDGSVAELVWKEKQWVFSEVLDSAPCDVAARDSL